MVLWVLSYKLNSSSLYITPQGLVSSDYRQALKFQSLESANQFKADIAHILNFKAIQVSK